MIRGQTKADLEFATAIVLYQHYFLDIKLYKRNDAIKELSVNAMNRWQAEAIGWGSRD